VRAALWAALAVGTSAAAPLLRHSIEPDGPGSTALAFEAQTFDFGSVRAGTEVDAEFAFRNDTGRAIRIASVRGSCGCLKAEASTTVVEPGARGTVKVKVSTTGRQGAQSFRVHVRTDEGAQGGTTLRVKGEIRIAFRARPAQVVFGAVEPGTERTADVRVEKLEPVEGITVTARGEGLSVERVAEDAQGLTLRVALKVPWSRTARGTSVTLATKDASSWIPVTWHVPAPFELSVRQVELRGGKGELVAKPRWPSVRLDRVSVRNLPIDVERDGDRISLTLKEPTAQLPFGSTLELVPEPASLGSVRVPVRVRAD
jgi:hypothetical protein